MLGILCRHCLWCESKRHSTLKQEPCKIEDSCNVPEVQHSKKNRVKRVSCVPQQSSYDLLVLPFLKSRVMATFQSRKPCHADNTHVVAWQCQAHGDSARKGMQDTTPIIIVGQKDALFTLWRVHHGHSLVHIPESNVYPCHAQLVEARAKVTNRDLRKSVNPSRASRENVLL